MQQKLQENEKLKKAAQALINNIRKPPKQGTKWQMPAESQEITDSIGKSLKDKIQRQEKSRMLTVHKKSTIRNQR